ncbi:MAG TPA: sensor histidine kinase [Bacteroidia bacterium]|nr:sensor histidine kinase [Bacteroidia bacterium]
MSAILLVAVPFAARAYDPPVSVRSLRSIADVRKLSFEEARLAPPVALRVTVISHHPDGFDGQDGSGGLFFECPAAALPRIGDEMQVAGNAMGGLDGPYAIVDAMEKTGWRSPPKALNFRPDFVQTGLGDNRWIEIEGLLVDVSFGGSRQIGSGLLVTGQSDLVVRFRNAYEDFDVEGLERMVGSWVRLQGSGAPLFNDQRQRIGSDLVCAKGEFVSVLEQTAESGVVHLDEIGRWDTRRTRPGLVQTSGTVTLVEGPSSLVVQAGDRGARVRTLRPVKVGVGEPVDLTGLPETEGYFVGLRYATVTPSETGEPPAEAVLDESPLSREHAFQLVTFSGRLIEKGREVVNLQVNEGLIPVGMPAGLVETLPAEGSELRIVGVKRVEADERGEVRSVTLSARTAADIQVLAVPSWWTPARYWTAIMVLASGVLLFLTWLLALNRRVRKQTELISEQIESNATLEERNRIARELHDTLSQGFSGVGYQLASVANHLVSDPEKARAKLEAAREMVEHSLAEARDSLIGLRVPTGAESLDFPDATLAAARERCEEAGVAFEADRSTWRDAVVLPPETAFACHRIVLEAVANALRHSGAGHLKISLAAESAAPGPGRVRIAVADDGSGFAVEAKAPEGHYGLQGMRERAQRLGADFAIRSSPGEGTIVELSLNLT